MKGKNRWLAIGLAAAMVLTGSDPGINTAEVNAAEQETVAYLEFASKWGENYNYGTDSKVIADNAVVDGDGVYRISLDFSEVDEYFKCAHGIAQCTIHIIDGVKLYGSNTVIDVRSVMINGEEVNISAKGYTYDDDAGQTSMCLHNGWMPAGTNQRTVSGQELPQPAPEDYQLLTEVAGMGTSDTMNGIKTLDVTFAFAKNAVALAKIPADATPKPHSTAGAVNTPTQDPTPTGNTPVTTKPDPKPTGNTPVTTKPDPKPTGNTPVTTKPDPKPTGNAPVTTKPDPKPTGNTPVTTNPGLNPTSSTNPDTSPLPSGTPSASASPAPTSSVVSNSTYTGAEKILVSKPAVVIPAGKSSTVTIALLRSASSQTQVTATSANKGIAVPTLQNDGKVSIAVPAGAQAGSSTTVTLGFGSSSAAVKVTVSNPLTKMAGAKKSYKIKRNKTGKISVKLTAVNNSVSTTDTVRAKISKEAVASVESVKVSGSRANIKVKALKKGSAKLKVSAGGKSCQIKIKVK